MAIAHVTVTPRVMGFGIVKEITTKSIKIKNTGNIAASVTIVSPQAPFSIVAGGGSFSLAPQAVQVVSVQFAPTAVGRATAEAGIQCANCNTLADDNVVVRLRGYAKIQAANPAPSSSAANALPFSVTAGPSETVDLPFASVTICATGTSNCATINDVVIDTGSFGLRIFGSQLSGLGVAPNADGDGEVGECAFFGSGSTWGSVSTVDVKLAGEPPVTIPIQVIDDINAFAPAPSDCTQGTPLMSSPGEAGFNGLLGVGQASNDSIFTDYFACSGENCSSLANPPQSDLVPNPVSSLPVDNNGVVMSLPSISASGQISVQGTLFFGIGTQSNNQPGTVKAYVQDSNPNEANYLEIETVYNGQTAGGFFDTGSNGYFFNDGSINECTDGSGFYCPADTLSLSATNKGMKGSVSGVVSFQVANADRLFDSNDAGFDDLGATFDGGTTYDGFDWGLPFFFGRKVYMGNSGTSSSLGAGPYIAY